MQSIAWQILEAKGLESLQFACESYCDLDIFCACVNAIKSEACYELTENRHMFYRAKKVKETLLDIVAYHEAPVLLESREVPTLDNIDSALKNCRMYSTLKRVADDSTVPNYSEAVRSLKKRVNTKGICQNAWKA